MKKYLVIYYSVNRAVCTDGEKIIEALNIKDAINIFEKEINTKPYHISSVSEILEVENLIPLNNG